MRRKHSAPSLDYGLGFWGRQQISIQEYLRVRKPCLHQGLLGLLEEALLIALFMLSCRFSSLEYVCILKRPDLDKRSATEQEFWPNGITALGLEDVPLDALEEARKPACAWKRFELVRRWLAINGSKVL
jgi:hypothetical protein